MRGARGAQLGALITIIDALETSSRYGVTLGELAARTGLSGRSVRRYLDELQPPFMDVEVIRDGTQTRWRWKSGGRGMRLALSPSECLALARVHAATLVHWRDAPWLAHLRSAFTRIEGSIPASVRELFISATEVNEAAPIYPSALERWREELEDAARRRRVVGVTYRGMTGREAYRKLDPYVLYVADGATYVHGYDHKSRERRVLALDRISLARVLDDTFELPGDFSAASFVANLFHGYKREAPLEITVRVHGRAARLWRDRPEAADQTLEPLEAGGLRVRFTAPMSPALIGRLLSFGAELEVESPVELRDAVVEQLRSAVKQYAAVASRERKPLAVERHRGDRGKARA